MNARQRGCIIFAVMVIVGILFCGLAPFVWMPAAGIGMALPVIAVPGEVVTPGGLFGIDLTNTLIGTVLADLMVLAFALLAWRASRGWIKEIPGRFQAFAETLDEGFYGFLKGIGGDRLRTAPFPPNTSAEKQRPTTKARQESTRQAINSSHHTCPPRTCPQRVSSVR